MSKSCRRTALLPVNKSTHAMAVVSTPSKMYSWQLSTFARFVAWMALELRCRSVDAAQKQVVKPLLATAVSLKGSCVGFCVMLNSDTGDVSTAGMQAASKQNM